MPCYSVGYELYTHACAGTFFDPLPTWWHVLAILPVPVTCFLTWKCRRQPTESLVKLLSILNRAAWPVALLYGAAYLWLSWIAAIVLLGSLRHLPFFFLALACLGPVVSLICLIVATCVLRLIRHRMGVAEAVILTRQGRKGWLLGMALLLVAEGPVVWTEIWLEVGANSTHQWNSQALRVLRATGNKQHLLRHCYETTSAAVYGPTIGMFKGGTVFASVTRNLLPGTSFTRARGVYYQVTGNPFNDLPPPRLKQTIVTGLGDDVRADNSFDDMVWDGERGGSVVGARLRGLSLATSSMEWQMDAPAAQAYGEWTLEFSNRHANAQEARSQILLPPGGVVSRVNLWINGEPREAAFGAKAQVTAAYRQVVVVERRDPVLVNMCGPDRVAVQCFPVPPGGIMKIRLGITAPCDERNGGKLALPVIIERNFSIGNELKHWVRSRWDGTVRDELEMLDANLLQARLQPLPPAAPLVWTEDPFARGAANVAAQPKFLSRQKEAVVPRTPGRVIMVLDGSARLQPHATALREALASIPSNLPVTVLLATDREPLVLSRSAAEKEIRASSFVGGRDNTVVLTRALQLAGDKDAGGEPATLLWLHGPQPWTFGTPEPVMGRDSDSEGVARAPFTDSGPTAALVNAIRKLPQVPTIHAIEVSTGPNRVLETLYQTTNLRNGSRWDGTAAGLKSLVLAAVNGGEAWHYRYTRSGEPPHEGVKVWDHLARQQVYEDVLSAFKGTNTSPEDLARRAALYHLVTPYSGAVVLETREQYLRAGLDPVDPNASPKIPNIVPEPSRAVLLLIAAAAMVLRRRRRL